MWKLNVIFSIILKSYFLDFVQPSENEANHLIVFLYPNRTHLWSIEREHLRYPQFDDPNRPLCMEAPFLSFLLFLCHKVLQWNKVHCCWHHDGEYYLPHQQPRKRDLGGRGESMLVTLEADELTLSGRSSFFFSMKIYSHYWVTNMVCEKGIFRSLYFTQTICIVSRMLPHLILCIRLNLKWKVELS